MSQRAAAAAEVQKEERALWIIHALPAMSNTTISTTPARLPAKRGLLWFAEVLRAVRAKPLLWLPAALVLVVMQGAVLTVWTAMLAATEEPNVVSAFSVATAAITLTPLFLLCSLPLPVALFSGAAGRQFFHDFQGTHPLRRLLHALVFNALLAALLFAAYFGVFLLWLSIIAALQPHMHYTNLEAASAVCASLLAVCAFWLAFLILLAQVLAACGTPFLRALVRAARAALRPACVVHAAALATGVAAAFVVVVTFDSLAPHTWQLALACAFAFSLDALITPWLMARDMFSAGAE